MKKPYPAHPTKPSPEIFERMKATFIAYDKDVLAEAPSWYERDPRMKDKVPTER